MEWYEKFEKVIELLGSDEVAHEIMHYFPSNNVEEFTEHLISSRDLESEFENE